MEMFASLVSFGALVLAWMILPTSRPAGSAERA